MYLNSTQTSYLNEKFKSLDLIDNHTVEVFITSLSSYVSKIILDFDWKQKFSELYSTLDNSLVINEKEKGFVKNMKELLFDIEQIKKNFFIAKVTWDINLSKDKFNEIKIDKEFFKDIEQIKSILKIIDWKNSISELADDNFLNIISFISNTSFIKSDSIFDFVNSIFENKEDLQSLVYISWIPNLENSKTIWEFFESNLVLKEKTINSLWDLMKKYNLICSENSDRNYETDYMQELKKSLEMVSDTNESSFDNIEHLKNDIKVVIEKIIDQAEFRKFSKNKSSIIFDKYYWDNENHKNKIIRRIIQTSLSSDNINIEDIIKFLGVQEISNQSIKILSDKKEVNKTEKKLSDGEVYKYFIRLWFSVEEINENSPTILEHSRSKSWKRLNIKLDWKYVNIKDIVNHIIKKLWYEAWNIKVWFFQDWDWLLLEIDKWDIKKNIFLSLKENHNWIHIIHQSIDFSDINPIELHKVLKNRVLTSHIKSEALDKLVEALLLNKQRIYEMYKNWVFDEIKDLKYLQVWKRIICKWNKFIDNFINWSIDKKDNNYPESWYNFIEKLNSKDLIKYKIMPNSPTKWTEFFRLLWIDPYFNEYKWWRDKYLWEMFQEVMNNIWNKNVDSEKLDIISKKAFNEIVYSDEATKFKESILKWEIELEENDFKLLELTEEKFILWIISKSIEFSDKDLVYIYNKKYGSGDLDDINKISELKKELNYYIDNNNRKSIKDLVWYFEKTPSGYQSMHTLIILFWWYPPEEKETLENLKDLIWKWKILNWY